MGAGSQESESCFLGWVGLERRVVDVLDPEAIPLTPKERAGQSGGTTQVPSKSHSRPAFDE
jgi:hypothetical protein